MKCYSHLQEENMSDNKSGGLKIDAIFPTMKETIKAKKAIIDEIKANNGHGQCRVVPPAQLKGPNSPIKIESNDSNKDRK